MNTRNDIEFPDDAVVSAIEAGAPIDVWTLDELNRYSELDSVRSAWMERDGPTEH